MVVLEGGEEAGEVFAQVGAELVACLGAVPDGVLLGAGHDGDGAGEFAVFGQMAVRGLVRAQDVREHDRVEVIGLSAGDGVAVAVTGGSHRVDGVDKPTGGTEAGDGQTAGSLDREGDRGVGSVAVCAEEIAELVQPVEIVGDPGPG